MLTHTVHVWNSLVVRYVVMAARWSLSGPPLAFPSASSTVVSVCLWELDAALTINCPPDLNKPEKRIVYRREVGPERSPNDL